MLKILSILVALILLNGCTDVGMSTLYSMTFVPSGDSDNESDSLFLDYDKTIPSNITKSSPKSNWTSPADWLYVRENNGMVETAYGNFNYKHNDGIKLIKEGKELGILKVGRINNLRPNNPRYDVKCDEIQRECNITLDYGNEKVLLLFDKFELTIEYEYKSKIPEQSKFYFELKTDSKIKEDYKEVKYFENKMVFNYNDLTEQRFNNKSIINKTIFKDNKLRIETNSLNLKEGEKILLDPTWSTPSAISNCSSEHSAATCAKSIDGDISGGYATYWTELASPTDKNEGDYEWYITYDMGSSQCIHSIRIYTHGESPDKACKAVIIKVCDDVNCNGESNLIASECTFSASKEWQTCTLDTDTEGRYIYVEGGKCAGSLPYGCQDKETGDDMTYFHEFEADTDGTCASPVGNSKATINLISPADHHSTTDTTPDITFNFTDIENSTLNCSLYFGGVLNLTNSTTQNNTNTIFTPTLSIAQHWYNISCDLEGNSSWSSTRNLTITTTTDSCDPTAGQANTIQGSDFCNLTMTRAFGGNLLTFNGTGLIQISGTLTDCEVKLLNGCSVKVFNSGNLCN